MLEKIDVRGMALEQAIQFFDQKLKSGTVAELEILASDEQLVISLVGHISRCGMTVDEITSQDNEQRIIVTSIVQQSLKAYVVGQDTLGGDVREIGEKLMTAYFNVSAEYPKAASTIFFLNTGINLVLEGAATLDALKQIEQKGTEIIVCGTCLDFFGKREQLGVGRIGTMHDLLALHHGKSEVITL